MGGRPCIRGLRMTVAAVLRLVAAGHSTPEILDANIGFCGIDVREQGGQFQCHFAEYPDGTDGSTDDAGAIVDGGTLRRGRDGGCDAVQCLAAADSGRFLEASGDLVHTGPTGTNVGDLLIALGGDLPHSWQAPDWG